MIPKTVIFSSTPIRVESCAHVDSLRWNASSENSHLADLAAGNITFRDLVIDGIVEWVDAEEEEDLYIAPRPFVLPETVPEGPLAGRPVTTKRFAGPIWRTRCGMASIEAEVRMPNGSIEIAKFDVPLLFSSEHSHVEMIRNSFSVFVLH